MNHLRFITFSCLTVLTFSKNIRCGPRTQKEVTIEDGETFVFETQRKNELEYGEFVRCSARYMPGRSCLEIGFSCSKMAILGKGSSCKGDFLEVVAGKKMTRYCRGRKPSLVTSASTTSIRVKFWTNRDRKEAGGADCLVKCTKGASASGALTTTTTTGLTTTTTTA